MKKIIAAITIIIIISAGAYLLTSKISSNIDVVETDTTIDTPASEAQPNNEQEEEKNPSQTVIGRSADGKDITAYHYGNGDTNLLLIGGIHGGYSWNTALVAYEAIDYLEANPDAIPDNIRVTVIPVLNPDGLQSVVGSTGRFEVSAVPTVLADRIPGRFNANDVDLNRNFDCDWQASGTWQNRSVSGGDAPFSEPESKAIRDYVAASRPDAALVWYSSAGGVFASSCHNGVLPETRTLTNTFAKASGYKAYEEFDFYEITGDMVNWFAKEQIPAISVLLTTHEGTEWSKNRAGIEAILEYYAK